MTIKDVLSKLITGEALTEEEKAFAKSYDEDKVTGRAAASARKSAETARDKALAELEALKEQQANGESQKDSEIQKLNERVKVLEADKAEAVAKVAKVERSEKIAEAFKTANIKVAKGVSEKAFSKLMEFAFDGVDVDNAEEVKKAVEAFKADNAGIIADVSNSGTGGGNTSPRGGSTPVINPFAKETENLTEQIRLSIDNPAEANRLMAEAGISGN